MKFSPTPLKLRKETERLAETVQDLRSEQEVRAVVADLYLCIIEWRRIPAGLFYSSRSWIRRARVARWHDAHPQLLRRRHSRYPRPPRPPGGGAAAAGYVNVTRPGSRHGQG